MAVTFEDLERRVRSRLSESDADFFSQQNVLDWLNEGQDVVCTAVGYTLNATWQARIPAYATAVRLTEECLRPSKLRMVSSTGRSIILDYVDPDQMDRFKTYRTSESAGTTTRFTVIPGVDGRILVWDVAQSEECELTVWGQMRPRQMTASSTSYTDLPDHLTHVVVSYALWMAKVKDEEAGQAKDARAQFASDMAELDEDRQRVQAAQFNTVRHGRENTGRLWRWWPWP